MPSLRVLLEEMLERNASDIHLSAGHPPQLRIDGDLTSSRTAEPLGPEAVLQLAYSILTEDQRKRFEKDKELDLSFGIRGVSRFRANVYMQRGSVSVAIRRIPFEILSFEELGLPPIVQELAQKPKGLILVTGPTGCGKSTTLASIIDKINEERRSHIITIEDPIEYVHRNKSSTIDQREVGADTVSFHAALKYVLRQDPDVILIGEMRDLETIQAALTIAETGHLALATLHTNSAAESINRIVDVFPAGQKNEVQAQLAFVLEGVICQQLVPRSYGPGRVLIAEVLVCTPAIRAVIREGKIHQVYGMMQASAKFGMQTMNQSLFHAIRRRMLSREAALERSQDPRELEQMLGRADAPVASRA
ncbi:MAG: type IV pilus twitching motility protein PilT [Candidatus Eisenbacteria bacterium]|nr:type IV pilus twitching motility protein PilT [Candidatus Eisenbacteria bacterium]